MVYKRKYRKVVHVSFYFFKKDSSGLGCQDFILVSSSKSKLYLNIKEAQKIIKETGYDKIIILAISDV